MDELLVARLFAAFDLEILWNKPGSQATVFAEITENTLQAIPAIINPGQDGCHDTGTQDSTTGTGPIWDLTNTHGQERGTFMDSGVGVRGGGDAGGGNEGCGRRDGGLPRARSRRG